MHLNARCETARIDLFFERFIPYFALPNDDYLPASIFKLVLICPVSFYVPLKLTFPVICVRLGRGGMLAALMPVPEAAVNIDDRFVLRKYNIGLAREFLSVQSKPITISMQPFSDYSLRFRVGCTDL